MKHRTAKILFMLTSLAMVSSLMAIEEASYEVLRSDGKFELRQYAPRIVVETRVEADYSKAGNQAFRDLFGYISGDNQAQQEIAMTAPVSQGAAEKIAMTAPVSQQPAAAGGEVEAWTVNFLIPQKYTRETVPMPTNPRVYLREIPASLVAAVRYSGLWREKRDNKEQQELEQWMAQQGLKRAGEPSSARYNPPFTPGFMRRNEILLPVSLAGEEE